MLYIRSQGFAGAKPTRARQYRMGVMMRSGAIAALALMRRALVACLGASVLRRRGRVRCRAVFDGDAPQEIDDLKSVYATVRSKDLIQARVRTPGTIACAEGRRGQCGGAGAGAGARRRSQDRASRSRRSTRRSWQIQSRVETAKTELERSQELKTRGVAPQSRVDQAQTTYDVAVNDLKVGASGALRRRNADRGRAGAGSQRRPRA